MFSKSYLKQCISKQVYLWYSFNDTFQWFLFIAACSLQIKVFSYLLTSFCHFVCRMDFFPFQRINLKKAEVSSWEKFFKIGILKNFILFIRKHLCSSPEGQRPVTLYKKRYSQRRCFPVNVAKFLKDFYWNIPCWLQ